VRACTVVARLAKPYRTADAFCPDAVVMRGCCHGDGYRVGFGECRGTVLPARPL
jgi:hypothetical protein